jgi:hypothetical protein
LKKASKLDSRDLLDICAMRGVSTPAAAAGQAAEAAAGSAAPAEAVPAGALVLSDHAAAGNPGGDAAMASSPAEEALPSADPEEETD